MSAAMQTREATKVRFHPAAPHDICVRILNSSTELESDVVRARAGFRGAIVASGVRDALSPDLRDLRLRDHRFHLAMSALM
jgi:hypothetical protein